MPNASKCNLHQFAKLSWPFELHEPHASWGACIYWNHCFTKDDFVRTLGFASWAIPLLWRPVGGCRDWAGCCQDQHLLQEYRATTFRRRDPLLPWDLVWISGWLAHRLQCYRCHGFEATSAFFYADKIRYVCMGQLWLFFSCRRSWWSGATRSVLRVTPLPGPQQMKWIRMGCSLRHGHSLKKTRSLEKWYDFCDTLRLWNQRFLKMFKFF